MESTKDSPSRSQQETLVVRIEALIKELDPHLDDEKKTTGPIKELEEVSLEFEDLKRKVKIGTRLTLKNRIRIIHYLKKNKDVFAWCHEDIIGINPKTLTIDLT